MATPSSRRVGWVCTSRSYCHPVIKSTNIAGQVFAWNPSIPGAKSEDSILVGEQSNEIMTEMAGWPTIDVQIGDQIIRRPAILEKY